MSQELLLEMESLMPPGLAPTLQISSPSLALVMPTAKPDGLLNGNSGSTEPAIPRQHPQQHEATKIIFVWWLSRLVACIVMTLLTAFSVILVKESEDDDSRCLGWSIRVAQFGGFYLQDIQNTNQLNATKWATLLLCIFYTYTTLLAFFTLILGSCLRAVANSHLVALLLVAFGVHVCHDLKPLALSITPMDELSHDWPTWTRLIILGFAAVVVPVCVPRLYVPLDPDNPADPSSEQTAPLISLMFYQFFNPLVWAAYRAGKLRYDQLPPLADYDRAAHLKQRGFDQLDPFRLTKQRHLFWGLMYVFRKECYVMVTMIIIKSFIDFTGPISILFLLKYLEDPSNSGPIRPWVWVFWIFFGPVVGSVAIEWYKLLATRSVFYTEAILTQLLFEHTLRIRVVAEPSDRSRGNKDDPKGTRKASKTDSSNLVGKITNLMSTDLKNIGEGCNVLLLAFHTPIQIIVSIIFLYRILGWSAIAGTVVMVVSTPIPIKVASMMGGVQVERMKKTDARVQNVVESINLIRMVKMFAWESKIKTQVAEKREDELILYRRRQYLGLINIQANFLIPIAVMNTTYLTYTLWMKRPLDASTVFSSITVFDVLRTQLQRSLWEIPRTIQAKISLERVNDFLTNASTELLDAYTDKNGPSASAPASPVPSGIGFRDATFTWASRTPKSQMPSQRNFKLRIDGELSFQPGKIHMITGPTGCGKTSLLLALLGEMHFIPSSTDSWFGLPREGGIAYAAQEAWVYSGSIRENILFGTEYDEERYNMVISQCALEPDLLLLDAGDNTEVGERGITLSGGQKARVSLARAVYSRAEVVVLDDILSALDVHTSRWIVDRCLKGSLFAGRTVLIVTHNVALVSEVSDFVVLLGSDGRVASQGSVTQTLRTSSELRAQIKGELEEEQKQEQIIDQVDSVDQPQVPKRNSVKKLIVEEEVAQGHVEWSALKLFLLALGGAGFWVVYLTGFVLAALGMVLQTYWLGIWARAYSAHIGHPEEVSISFYLGVYSIICIASMLLFISAFVVHIRGSVRASRRIHDQLLAAMLGAPLRWFDSTPVGRMIARFTQDMSSIDGALPSTLQELVDMTVQLGLRLVAIVAVSPVFVFPGAILLVVGFWIGQVYIAAQLWAKRETSNARSPLFSHFGSAFAGITTIRAYEAGDQFRHKAMERIDNYTRAAITSYGLNRWICVRMDTLGAMFSGSLAAYLLYRRTSVQDASNTGFSLNMAIAFSGGILWWVRKLNDFEVQGNSLERIQAYIQIKQEPAATADKTPPAYWPSSGKISVENLVARYSSDGPAVLHGLTFKIKDGERVGVVGRTGSGKSSLTLSLLRMIPTEGNIYYDGIPIHNINLDALRSNITIIPQQPELMSGTIRQNLDPFDEHDDAALNAALQSAGLNTLQSEGDEGYIGLDSGVSAGGGNFSLGQRQVVALARAIVRRSKVLILDEATAAIDYNTDTAIQHSIRTELNNTTLIIVAHRLQTICDADKVMVLDAGNIVEFDSPAALLRKDKGVFKSLVDESGDKDTLYAMAKYAMAKRRD